MVHAQLQRSIVVILMSFPGVLSSSMCTFTYYNNTDLSVLYGTQPCSDSCCGSYPDEYCCFTGPYGYTEDRTVAILVVVCILGLAIITGVTCCAVLKLMNSGQFLVTNTRSRVIPNSNDVPVNQNVTSPGARQIKITSANQPPSYTSVDLSVPRVEGEQNSFPPNAFDYEAPHTSRPALTAPELP